MSKRFHPMLAVCVLLLLVGVGCSGSDLDVLFSFAQDWAVAHGITDSAGHPTPSAIGYVASGGNISTGDETSDAAIDAGQVVQSIDNADKHLSDADIALDKMPSDFPTALSETKAALNMRPNDPDVRSKRGEALVDSGDVTQGRTYLSTYSGDCMPGSPTGAKLDQCISRINGEAQSFDRVQTGSPNCSALGAQYDAYLRLSRLASAAGRTDDSESYDRSAQTTAVSAKACGGG